MKQFVRLFRDIELGEPTGGYVKAVDPNAPYFISDFEKELTVLINKYSIDNMTDTPDYILSRYLNDIIKAHACVVIRMEQHKIGSISKP